ncbi:MAG: phage terminase large subunit [Bacteroidota bacterium]
MEKKRVDIELGFHAKQWEIFYGSEARIKVIAKGRRFGLTAGMARYLIDEMINNKIGALWVDTTYSNITRYMERYFQPLLMMMPRKINNFNKTQSILYLCNSYCDFRSADRPENIEGFGYDLVIVNEAGIILKNRRLWEESIRPMMFEKKARAIIGGTPKGKKCGSEPHLFYELYNYDAEGKEGWKSYKFSSYDNQMIDRKELEEYEKEVSPALRDQEVYAEFIDQVLDRIIKREWFGYYEESELSGKRIIATIQSWDTAFKEKEENDYSVCQTWAVTNEGYYLEDVWRGRVEFPELKKKAVELFNTYTPNEILIEEKASGISLIQELQRETRIPIKPIKPDKDKLARVHSVTPIIEAGKVKLKGSSKWIKDYLDELEEFPNGEFDDQVDATSQFLNYIKSRNLEFRENIIVMRKIKKEKYLKYRR